MLFATVAAWKFRNDVLLLNLCGFLVADRLGYPGKQPTGYIAAVMPVKRVFGHAR
jgi:hypothetical protein